MSRIIVSMYVVYLAEDKPNIFQASAILEIFFSDWFRHGILRGSFGLPTNLKVQSFFCA